MKCKPLQGESGKTNSLSTYFLRCVHNWNEQNNENKKQFKGWLFDLCSLGIHQSSMVQRYQIYQLTEYIWYMFTTESLKGNLLIQMQLTLAYESHNFSCICFNNSLPHSCGGLLGLASVNGKRNERIWKVRELLWREMKSNLQSANEKSFLPYRQKKGKIVVLI